MLDPKTLPRGVALTPKGKGFQLDVHIEDHKYVHIRAVIFDEGPAIKEHATEVMTEAMKHVISSLARGKKRGAVGTHVGSPGTGYSYDGMWYIVDRADDET